MMKNIACIFPETQPEEGLVFPLVQVFDALVYLQALENDPTSELLSPLLADLRQQEKLQLLAPAPLQENRDRFLALIKDMHLRRDQYIYQLSMLTLAGMQQHKQESKQTILASLHSGTTNSTVSEEELLLWQSRLILKLGELLDGEQADLTQALAQVDAQKNALLATLRDEEENPFTANIPSMNAPEPTDTMQRHRLRAWSRLYLQTISSQPTVFITMLPVAIDRLQEAYEKQTQTASLECGTLMLPYMQPPLTPQQTPTLGSWPLHNEFTRKASMLFSLEPTSVCGILDRDWMQMLEQHYPASQYGRARITWFAFPEMTACDLFGAAFADQKTVGKKSAQPPCFIGLYTVLP